MLINLAVVSGSMNSSATAALSRWPTESQASAGAPQLMGMSSSGKNSRMQSEWVTC